MENMECKYSKSNSRNKGVPHIWLAHIKDWSFSLHSWSLTKEWEMLFNREMGDVIRRTKKERLKWISDAEVI